MSADKSEQYIEPVPTVVATAASSDLLNKKLNHPFKSPTKTNSENKQTPETQSSSSESYTCTHCKKIFSSLAKLSCHVKNTTCKHGNVKSSVIPPEVGHESQSLDHEMPQTTGTFTALRAVLAKPLDSGSGEPPRKKPAITTLDESREGNAGAVVEKQPDSHKSQLPHKLAKTERAMNDKFKNGEKIKGTEKLHKHSGAGPLMCPECSEVIPFRVCMNLFI